MQNNPETKPGGNQSISKEYHGGIVRQLHHANNSTTDQNTNREIRRASIFSGPAKMVLSIGISVLKVIARGIQGSLSLLRPVGKKNKLPASKNATDSLPHEEEL